MMTKISTLFAPEAMANDVSVGADIYAAAANLLLSTS